MKKFFCFILAILAMAGQAWGASCNSAASGTWSDNTKWAAPCNGSGVPGAGAFANYSAKIVSGHDFTVDDSRTIPATTLTGVDANNYATLTFATGTTVTMAGNIQGNNYGALVHAAGSIFDTNGFDIIPNTGVGSNFFRWYSQGTAGSRVVMSSSATGTNVIYTAGTSVLDMQWSYTDVNDSLGFSWDGGNSTFYIYNGKWYWDHSTFKGINVYSSASLQVNGQLKWENLDFDNSSVYILRVTGTITDPYNYIKNVTIRSNPQSTFTIVGNGTLIQDAVSSNTPIAIGGPNTTTNRVISYTPNGAADGVSAGLFSGTTAQTISNSVFASDETNWHGISFNSATTAVTYDVHDNILEGSGRQDNLMMSPKGSANIYKNIFIGMGNAITVNINPTETGTINFYNNTCYADSDGGSGEVIAVEPGSAVRTGGGVYVYNNVMLTKSGQAITDETCAIEQKRAFIAPVATRVGTGLNNLTWAGQPLRLVHVEIEAGGSTFKWRYENDANWQATGVSIASYTSTPYVIEVNTKYTTAQYSLGNTTVKFGSASGYTAGDYWVYNTKELDVHFKKIDYNAYWKFDPANVKDRYFAVMMSGKDPGVSDGFGLHDIDANPNFAYGSRNIGSYDATLGGDGTKLHYVTEMLKINGYGGAYNSAFTLDGLANYIKEGMTPTNSALSTAGEGGTYIGAMAPAPTGTPSIWQKIFKSRIFH